MFLHETYLILVIDYILNIDINFVYNVLELFLMRILNDDNTFCHAHQLY